MCIEGFMNSWFWISFVVVNPLKPKEHTIHEVILQGNEHKAQEMITNDEKLLKKTDEVSYFNLGN
jgi:hypothetical protein